MGNTMMLVQTIVRDFPTATHGEILAEVQPALAACYEDARRNRSSMDAWRIVSRFSHRLSPESGLDEPVWSWEERVTLLAGEVPRVTRKELRQRIESEMDSVRMVAQ